MSLRKILETLFGKEEGDYFLMYYLKEQSNLYEKLNS